MALHIGVAVGLAACGDAAGGPQDVERDPAVRGPWEVGVTTIEVSDPARPGRDLTVEIWYPALVAEGAERDQQFGIDLSSVRLAEPDHRGAPFPLVAFSHGNGGLRFQSVYLTEHLASHGYVVVAPDHPGNTFIDGDVTRTAETLRERPYDVQRAIDAALAQADGAGPLAGMVDGTRIGMSGHSYGGFTTLAVAGARFDLAAMRAACAADPEAFLCAAVDAALTEAVVAGFADARIDAALAMSPAARQAFGAAGLAAVPVPVQVQGGSLDTVTTMAGQVAPIFDGLPPARRALATIVGAAHFSFTDICALYELLGGPDGSLAYLATEGCGPNTIPVARVQAASRTLATAFFDRELRGLADDRGYLDPARGVPDTTLR